MKKQIHMFRAAFLASVCAGILCGCAAGQRAEENRRTQGAFAEEILSGEEAAAAPAAGQNGEGPAAPAPSPASEDASGSKSLMEGNEKRAPGEQAGDKFREISPEAGQDPQVTEIDWSAYFDGLNGAAVVYDASGRTTTIYNSHLASERRSPCSTFKIISSLTALENGLLKPEDSIRPWSGETFWNEDWNRDIDFEQAFRASCVWYFRQLTDEIGSETMQRELERLSYGNCDISDWEGERNTNNNNRALTGFWIESSLKISPREQVEVMERIFGENTVYSKTTLEELKKVMLVSQETPEGLSIYGKTGMGKTEGIVVDAWFTGFAWDEEAENRIFFCVWLGRTDGREVSSARAREIAIRIVSDCRMEEKDGGR